MPYGGALFGYVGDFLTATHLSGSDKPKPYLPYVLWDNERHELAIPLERLTLPNRLIRGINADALRDIQNTLGTDLQINTYLFGSAVRDVIDCASRPTYKDLDVLGVYSRYDRVLRTFVEELDKGDERSIAYFDTEFRFAVEKVPTGDSQHFRYSLTPRNVRGKEITAQGPHRPRKIDLLLRPRSSFPRVVNPRSRKK